MSEAGIHMKITMHRARVLAKSNPGLFQSENSATTVDHHNNRITPHVFTVNSSDVLPPHNIVTKAFYESVKPFIVVMRAMGVCPLRADNKGTMFILTVQPGLR
jgi:hypothetical protein